MEARIPFSIKAFCFFLTIFSLSISAEAKTPKEKRIALLGDSIIYHAKIERRLSVLLPGYIIDNYGVPMNTPFDMRGRVHIGKGDLDTKVLDPCQYGTVIVLGGFNGIWRDLNGKGSALTGLGKLYSKIKQCPIRLIALTMTPFGSYRGWTLEQQDHTNIVNRWLLSNPPNVDLVIDVTNCLIDPLATSAVPSVKKELTFDGLHLNKLGGEAIANCLYPILRKPYGKE